MVKIEFEKRDFVWVGLIVVLLGVGFGYAYGGGEPAVMGHDVGELELGLSESLNDSHIMNDSLTRVSLANDSVGNDEMINDPSFDSITLGGVNRNSWPAAHVPITCPCGTCWRTYLDNSGCSYGAYRMMCTPAGPKIVENNCGTGS